MGLIAEEDFEIYSYGVQELLATVSVWILFFAASALAGMAWYMVLFSIAFIPLRIYAGGLHMGTRTQCFLVSTVLVAWVFALFRIIDTYTLSIVSISLLVPSGIVVKLLAPVEDLRKPLNKKECVHYGKIAFSIFLITGAATILFFAFRLIGCAYFVGMANFMIATQLISGKIKNSFTKAQLSESD